MKKLLLLALPSLAAVSYSQTWNEVGDAGDLPATGQMTFGVGALTRINGSIVTPDGNDKDMFCIHLTGGNFSATTVLLTTLDTQLFLFDSAGMGLVGNDDAGDGVLQSTISGNFSAGDYWLVVSRFDRDPVNADGLEIFVDDFSGLQSPTGPGGPGPIAGWNGFFEPTASGPYGIGLTGAEFCAVPEPGTMAVLCIGAAALLRRRSRK